VPGGLKSDSELVKAVRNRGPNAFAELYLAHVGTVRGVAASVLGDDREAVADVVQEAFLRALYSLDTLQDPARLRAWLGAIARNLATDHLRNRRRVTALDEKAAVDLADTASDPVRVAELGELARRVEGCVAGLSRRDATAIALVTHFGFRTEQVASALGLSVGAAKVLLHRARRRLRQALVLQVLARQPQLACPELRRILDNDPAASASHVQSCDQCIASAANEVAAGGVATGGLAAGGVAAGEVPAGGPPKGASLSLGQDGHLGPSGQGGAGGMPRAADLSTDSVTPPVAPAV
jgi:RNA polymerase sigma factor (sigma-70 family)